MSIDPKAESFYHISPYSYCAGDPVNLVDPDGNSPKKEGMHLLLNPMAPLLKFITDRMVNYKRCISMIIAVVKISKRTTSIFLGKAL
jgi:hypothetical protein